MNIVCSGTINRDIVEFADGGRLESTGGLMYSVLSLAVLSSKDYRIIPVSNAGADIWNKVISILGQYEQVDLQGLNKCSCPNNTVYLRLEEGKERDEHTDLHLPAIEYSQIEPYCGCEVMMLNFTSGFEMNYETVRRVIDNFNGLIYIDIHSLTLGIDENRHRIPRRIDEGLKWIEGAEFVQATEKEVWSFFMDSDRVKGVDWAGSRIAERCGQAFLMTRGRRGVSVFSKAGIFHIPGLKLGSIVDTTGCGDVFGAAFILEYLRSGSIMRAAENGNEAAAKKCLISGIEDIKLLK